MNHFAILGCTILLSINLTACGGGGGGGGGQSTAQSTPNLTIQEKVNATYYIVDADDLSSASLTYVDNVIPNADFSNTLSADDYVLTDKGLYNNTSLPVETKALSSSLLYFSDTPGSGNFVHLKKINLSGVNVYNQLFPGFADFFAKYGTSQYFSGSKAAALYNAQATFFPSGSECYQMDKVENLKPYITFSTTDITTDPYSDVISGYNDGISQYAESNGDHLKVLSGNYNGYAWKLFQVSDAYGIIFEQVIVNYKGKAVFAEMNDFDSFNRAELLNTYQTRFTDPKSSDYNSDFLQLDIRALQSDCAYYNQAAFNTIQSFDTLK